MATGPCAAIGSTVSGLTSIVNGSTCPATNSPVVLLHLVTASGASLDCSGTIIAARALLTAGHCVLDAASARVALGTGVEVGVTAMAASPAYVANPNSPQDIGVMLVGQDLPRQPMPLLFSRGVRVGESAVIAGWGAEANNINYGVLRAAMTTVSAVTDFIESDFGVSPGQVCPGDSGGALLVSDAGVWTLGAVVSGGSAAACNKGQSFYSIVHNPDVMAFIVSLVPGAIRR